MWTACTRRREVNGCTNCTAACTAITASPAGREYPLAEISARHGAAADGVPRCDCGGMLKPSVVLYGEPLPDATVAGAVAAIRACDLLIIGGTSLSVYPAAGFVRLARGRIALINKTATACDDAADLVIRDSVEILAGLF